MTTEALSGMPGGGVVAGMGNVAGAGALLLRYWATVGEDVSLATLPEAATSSEAREGADG